MHRLTGTARNGGFLFTKNLPSNYQGGKNEVCYEGKRNNKSKKDKHLSSDKNIIAYFAKKWNRKTMQIATLNVNVRPLKGLHLALSASVFYRSDSREIYITFAAWE